MKEKRNKASRGHGGVLYQRDLHERLESARQIKTLKRLRRIERKRGAALLAPGVQAFLRKLARQSGYQPPVPVAESN